MSVKPSLKILVLAEEAEATLAAFEEADDETFDKVATALKQVAICMAKRKRRRKGHEDERRKGHQKRERSKSRRGT